MNIVVFLLLSYSICFGMQNKVPFLWGKHKFLDLLLTCTYCAGFHSGWISYLLLNYQNFAPDINILLYALISSGFCYGVDAVVKYLESNTKSL